MTTSIRSFSSHGTRNVTTFHRIDTFLVQLVFITVIPSLCSFSKVLAETVAIDAAAGSSVSSLIADVPGRRLITSPTGPLDRDFDDVRRVADAVDKGIKRAKAAGAVKPLLVLSGSVVAGAAYSKALESSLLAALAALYTPLSVRASKGEDAVEPVTDIFFLWAGPSKTDAELTSAAATARAIETGRRLARDLGGGDPEAMAPPRAAEYTLKALAGCPGVTVTVEADQEVIRKEYPTVHAVTRAALPVPRHHARIVRLEYTPVEGPVTKQVYLVGKGVTYDTGGADVKTGGHMAGMSRDKCGAATAAGFIATLSSLQAKGVRAVAYLGWVRNSIGSDSFVSDEIITTRAGKKILIVNTDAEGRMVMIDLLAKVREEITAQPKETRPQTVVHTIATLTGHAIIAVGFGYTIAVENGPAKAQGVSSLLSTTGASIGDCFEVSSLRREDFAFVAPTTPEYDVKQCNTAPSSQTPRGHQFPAAVMTIASGLDAHGSSSADPIAYCHLDIAGSSVSPPFLDGQTTGQPLAALVTAYAL